MAVVAVELPKDPAELQAQSSRVYRREKMEQEEAHSMDSEQRRA